MVCDIGNSTNGFGSLHSHQIWASLLRAFTVLRQHKVPSLAPAIGRVLTPQNKAKGGIRRKAQRV